MKIHSSIGADRQKFRHTSMSFDAISYWLNIKYASAHAQRLPQDDQLHGNVIEEKEIPDRTRDERTASCPRPANCA